LAARNSTISSPPGRPLTGDGGNLYEAGYTAIHGRAVDDDSAQLCGGSGFNLTQPEGADTTAYLARWQEFNDIVHSVVRELHGSISAEHGVGRLKRDEITHYKSPVEMELMRTVKRALDPANIMNPGKLVSV
jgi:hypothetical protein